ncbi:MAG: hypothetical protein QM503_08200 [Bacteroidota bacterium]
MSNSESKFVNWFASIAAALIVASIISLIGMYRTTAIVSQKVDANEKGIIETKLYHEKDVQLIRNNIKEIKSDQKVIMSDIKQILKEIK